MGGRPTRGRLTRGVREAYQRCEGGGSEAYQRCEGGGREAYQRCEGCWTALVRLSVPDTRYLRYSSGKTSLSVTTFGAGTDQYQRLQFTSGTSLYRTWYGYLPYLVHCQGSYGESHISDNAILITIKQDVLHNLRTKLLF